MVLWKVGKFIQPGQIAETSGSQYKENALPKILKTSRYEPVTTIHHSSGVPSSNVDQNSTSLVESWRQ